jgi:hypothetical protein
MQTIPRPSGAFRLAEIPRPVRTTAAESVIRRERLLGFQAIELKLAALHPSPRLYVLTGERA